ncbi:hypothetical protein ACA910_019799 [Epithemia clementina (nom. ined.)]
MMRYTFWHGKSSSSSDGCKWVEEAEQSMHNNTWTSPVYIDGSGFDDANSIREEAAKRLLQSMSRNTSAPSLVLQNAKLSPEMGQMFAEAMAQNKTLRAANIRNLTTAEGSYELPFAVFTNPNIESINVAKVTFSTETCRQLSRFIVHSSSLRSLALENILGIDRKGLQSILAALVLSRSLTSFKLKGIELSKEDIKRLMMALSFNQSITNLSLEGMNLDLIDAVEIAKLLQRNKTITQLSLRQNQLDAKALEVMVSQSLGINETLQGLFLARNPLGESSGQYIAQLLKNNTALIQLCLVDTKMMEQDCIDVFQSLRHNATLRTISMDGNHVKACGAALLESLEQHNTTLQSVLDHMPAFLARCSKTNDSATAKTSWNQVEFYLRANKANRRCLNSLDRSPRHSLERENVPYFLEGAGNQADVLFHFFRQSLNHTLCS